MKTFISFSIFLAFALNFSAQNNWTKKADFGGSGRLFGVGFSIGSKGYFGTGFANKIFFKDLWEYNSVTDVWTQKADMTFARGAAVGFSIGSKGYIGTGLSEAKERLNDFWEYNPNTNVWTPKAAFAGVERYWATGFSIGSKGYIGTGSIGDTLNLLKDFWEYDPATDVWTSKAAVGTTSRSSAVGFSIGTKGYIGTGYGNKNVYLVDFWEYNPANDTWTQKQDFPGGVGNYAFGFSIGNKGYLGSGDFWEFDPSKNTWTQKADIYAQTEGASGLSIGSKGYLGLGFSLGASYSKGFWEYTQTLTSTTEENLFNENFQVFPNPTKSNVWIKPKSNQTGLYNISVSNNRGQILINSKTDLFNSPFLLKFEEFPNGVYFLKMTDEHGIAVTKIIKE